MDSPKRKTQGLLYPIFWVNPRRQKPTPGIYQKERPRAYCTLSFGLIPGVRSRRRGFTKKKDPGPIVLYLLGESPASEADAGNSPKRKTQGLLYSIFGVNPRRQKPTPGIHQKERAQHLEQGESFNQEPRDCFFTVYINTVKLTLHLLFLPYFEMLTANVTCPSAASVFKNEINATIAYTDKITGYVYIFDASALFTEVRHLNNRRENVAPLDKTRVASHTMRTES